LEKGGVFDGLATGKHVSLTIDGRHRRATEALRHYLERLDLPCVVSLKAEDSAHSPQLQAIDHLVGAIYAAYAYGRWQYIDRLRKGGIRFDLRVLKAKKPAP